MQKTLLKLLAGSSVLTALAIPAYADNSEIEEALRARPDLSMFYEGLVSTGVIHELKEDKSYTLFAPTNDAFAKFSVNEYPCFYSEECKEEAAQILRNHIVPGEKQVSDIGAEPGSTESMFAINKHHITGSQPYKNNYAIEGHKVLSESQLSGSVLYRLNGVIATPEEMSEFTTPVMAMVHVPGTNQLVPPRVPDGTIVDITVPMAPEE